MHNEFNKLFEINYKLKELPYMTEAQSEKIKEIILKHNIETVLELGTYHGKSTLCMAAIMEDLGRGHITTMDRMPMISSLEPKLIDLAKRFKLSHRITEIHGQKAYYWDMNKMIKAKQKFDLVYIDSAHIFYGAALAFYLSDEMLNKDGVVLFDDCDWIPGKHGGRAYNDPTHSRYVNILEDDEINIKGVNEVANIVAARSNYTELEHTVWHDPEQKIPTWRLFRKLF